MTTLCIYNSETHAIDHVATGAKLKAMIHQAELSQHAAASLFNISPAYLCQLLQGQRCWTEERAKIVVDALNEHAVNISLTSH